MRPASLGFTLVEVLTIIVILTIIAGLVSFIAGPAVAKQKSYPGCASNLHQIAAGYLMYQGDNDGGLPVATSLFYIDSTMNYIPDEIRTCPLLNTKYWDNYAFALGGELGHRPRNETFLDSSPIPAFDPESDVIYRCLEHGFGGYYRGTDLGYGRASDYCYPGSVLGVGLNGSVRKVMPYSCYEFAFMPVQAPSTCPAKRPELNCER